MTISEDVSSSIWNQSQADLQLSKTLLGQQRGLIAGVSVEGQERSLPSITWLAFDGSIDENEVWPGIGGSNGVRYAEIATTNAPERPLMVVVNAVLAEELNLTEGDSIELGWYVTDDNQRQRLTSNASVLKVVANTGQGAAAGTSTPALFTDLNTAQRLQQLEGRVEYPALCRCNEP